MVSERRSRKPARTGPQSLAALNLNGKRDQRAEMFAARRAEQGKGDATELPIIWGEDDKVIATLGPEFPLDVFAPLLAMDVDLAALIMQVMQAIEQAEDNAQLGEVVISALFSNPTLPQELLAAARQVGCNLLGDDGFQAWLDGRPSGPDYVALGSGLMEWYGLDLGKLWGSSPSSTDGGTSEQTSGTTTPAPILEESGDSPVSQAS